MRNKHVFKEEIECKCPKCGSDFYKKVTVEYETNQRGDVIKHTIR